MRFSSKTFKRGLRLRKSRSKRSKRFAKTRRVRKIKRYNQRGGENGTAYRDYYGPDSVASGGLPNTDIPDGAVEANPLKELDAA